jgi:hypothetical protein
MAALVGYIAVGLITVDKIVDLLTKAHEIRKQLKNP